MGLVRDDDEPDRPQMNHTRTTKSVTRLFDELLNSGSTIKKTRDKSKSSSPPLTATNEDPPLPSTSDTTPSPPPVETSHMASGSKHSSILTQRILEGLQSQYLPHHQRHESSSPTDSHHRSRSRHRNSRSSETISALLLVTHERLSQETSRANQERSRANEAERQASEVLAHFKIAHQAKQRLEIDLQRVKDELGLYKTQLDIARAEIRRAQETVNKVDQQRVEAEDEARRGREKIRKLTEARSVELAMEEGRRLGYEEGIRQGRFMAQQAGGTDINQPIRYYRRSSFRSAREDDDDDQVSYFSYTQEERRSSESFQSPTYPSTSVRSSSGRRRRSDARRSAPPISPSATPRIKAPNHNPIPSSASNADDNNINRPEDITVQPQPQPNPTQPIPIHNHSPTISHPPFKLPDGYIPTLDANSVISLPPPHGLSTPVPPRAAVTPTTNAPPQAASTSRSFERISNRKRTPKPTNDNMSQYTLSRHPHITMKRNSRPGFESEAASTRISESSLLGPPDNIIGRTEDREEEQVDYFNYRRSDSRASSTRPERIAATWRCVNPDIRTPSLSPSPAPSAFLDGYNEVAARMQGNFTIERPKSTDPARKSQPRRPRDIVLPPSPITRSLPLIPTNNQNHAQETTDQREQGNQYETPPSAGHRDNTRPQLFLSRSTSNMTVPGIEIVTPSDHTLSTLSERTTIDPVLLTPESANRPTPLPNSPSQTPSQPTTTITSPPNSSLGLYFNQQPSNNGGQERINMVLPDNSLPHGFVPLSPIPGMKNLDSYGFGPMKMQDEHGPGGRVPPGFTYPASPIVR